jgi:ATP-dependent Clp protease adaptor protein ClpS
VSELPDIHVTTRTQPRERHQTRRVPPYNVILENDDHHSMEFVVEVLQKALGCAPERAVQFMMLAHHSGQAIVWTGTKEVAELKVDQIRTFHETREPDAAPLGPLSCRFEPAPGAGSPVRRRHFSDSLSEPEA